MPLYSPTVDQVVKSVEVELDNDEIKALPATDIQLVAAQGANTLIIPTDFIWDLNPSGGAYTNITSFETFSQIGNFGVDVGYVEADQGYFALTDRIFYQNSACYGDQRNVGCGRFCGQWMHQSAAFINSLKCGGG